MNHTDIERPKFYNCFKCFLVPPNKFIKCNCSDDYKEVVEVDACLAEEVSNLWSKGVRTCGCCCGHGNFLGFINVCEEDIEKMYSLGYQNYIFDDTISDSSRKDTFIPKTTKHLYCGYTKCLWG